MLDTHSLSPVLNIGTASQLAVVVTAPPLDHSPSVLPLPYFTDHSLLVSASLTGGNVVRTLVITLRSWLTDLGVAPPTEEEVYARLITRAEERLETPLRVDVRLWGERHAHNQRGGVANITPDNVSLGDVGSAVIKGIVENLRSLFTPALLQQLGVGLVPIHYSLIPRLLQ